MLKARIIFFLIGFILVCHPAVASDDAGFFASFQNLDQNRWYVSNGWSNGDHQSCEWRAELITTDQNRLQMELSDHGGKVRPIGCSELHTNARLGYGLYETRMRTAAGSGLNTAFFTYVGPPVGVSEWDEIDFEFLGKDSHSVQINYYVDGTGNHEVVVPLGYDASIAFHNYAFEWAPEKIRWFIDGRKVHETPDGAKLPRNPASLYLSLWSGSNIEDWWLGPFRYTRPARAEVEWVSYTPSDKKCLFPQSLSCK